MTERKVINKYYPPDYDPCQIPRKKKEQNLRFIIRIMAPFTMRCKRCGEFIYKGRKFNARKEDVLGEKYLGMQIYRFYIRCTKCLSEITVRTDPANSDYALEHGATRTFESYRLAVKQLEEENRLEKQEIEMNPMKLLEKRTRESQNEMAALELLEELKELNAKNRHCNLEDLIKEHQRVFSELDQQKLIDIKKKEEDDIEEEYEKLKNEAFGNITKVEEKLSKNKEDNCDILPQLIDDQSRGLLQSTIDCLKIGNDENVKEKQENRKRKINEENQKKMASLGIKRKVKIPKIMEKDVPKEIEKNVQKEIPKLNSYYDTKNDGNKLALLIDYASCDSDCD
ncbi:hypothetical protein SNEBB_003270 [Seison nebaliae]|nr:hypothetical protein SNEBB_003270 [Seison nebaliae]